MSAADGVPEVSRDVRAKVAIGKLQVQKQAALLYVKGMTCPSCAIGIRVKLSKLDFVDGSRFKRGIEMDCNNQLLTVALKDGTSPNWTQIEQEIDNAGYVAVEWFSMQKDELKSYPFLKVAE
ncbi:MAG: heavy-metal-associated domain-containing protein [Limisphaerales bacterium]